MENLIAKTNALCFDLASYATPGTILCRVRYCHSTCGTRGTDIGYAASRVYVMVGTDIGYAATSLCQSSACWRCNGSNPPILLRAMRCHTLCHYASDTQCPVRAYAMPLRVWCAMSGTNIRYAAVQCYAMSGTELAYSANRHKRARRG
eukprot:3496326-Rhodomonas_salina.7